MIPDEIERTVSEYASQRINLRAGNALISAPMRAIVVKRAYGSSPVTTGPPGWADCSSGSFLAAARSFPPRGQGSSWSARSRAAARTNELDAGKRRKIIEGEEGAGCGLAYAGVVCVFPACGWRSGLTSTHPAPRRRSGGCHDHVSGTGLLSHVIERGAGRRAHAEGRAHPGLGDPPVFMAAAAACWPRRPASRKAGARRGSAACGRPR